MAHLRIATRQSPLALWQAHFVANQLERQHPDLTVSIVSMTTQGDQILDKTLNKVGGKGLFVKALEEALLDHQADIAVHSMKDVPAEFPAGLQLPVIAQRAEVRDAFVASPGVTFDNLASGSTIGTSSLRRASQIKYLRPDLEMVPLRGNVNTRLKKLDNKAFDAIILAGAGLMRLGLHERINHYFETNMLLPAAGQGALGIECREGDQATLHYIAPLHHKETALCLTAERAVIRRLGGGCHMPIAAYATLAENTLQLSARVGYPDGRDIMADEVQGDVSQAEALGLKLAETLLARGADQILNSL